MNPVMEPIFLKMDQYILVHFFKGNLMVKGFCNTKVEIDMMERLQNLN